jgi:hypothetical protein
MRTEYQQASLLHRVQALLRPDDAAHAAETDAAACDAADCNPRGKRLLLIHGLLDDNVHARHALLLLQVTS